MTTSSGLFYKPRGAWAADFIPFYWAGRFHLFFLKDFRDLAQYGEGGPWGHVVTTDFRSFEELPDAIQPGGPDAQDMWPFTGSVIERDGTFHIFFTGHNPHLKDSGRPVQAIMHATSADLVVWQIDSENPVLYADHRWFEEDDWRDPFVFWNPDEQKYWMLLTARVRGGAAHRRGCVALATSPDLDLWDVHEPYWSPSLYFAHECPDMFKEGENWYLAFSEFTDQMVTHVRSAPTSRGPWRIGDDDALDTRAFYAAKTASDGLRRYAFGWLASRVGETDSGEWQWGGQLVVHQLSFDADGTVRVSPPPGLLQGWSEPSLLELGGELGEWTQSEAVTESSADGYAWSSLASMPPICTFEVTIAFDEQLRDVGVVLRSDPSGEHYYRIRLEPSRQRVVFDRYPRPGDEPYFAERPLPLSAGQPVHLRVFADRSAFVVYVQDSVAISWRGYDYTRGVIGLFATGGRAQFTGATLRTPRLD